MHNRSEMRKFAVGAAIVFATLGIFLQTRDHSFVEFDDPLYVTENRHVQRGLTAETITWAFVNHDAHLWHPLTWLSYLIDFELYGIDSAGPWVLTSVALHAANALLLLCALTALSGRLWPSAFVAAIFALHPVQVEAAVWVSSRKEVLAAFFFMLVLWSYAAYTGRGGTRRYLRVAGLLCLCLAAKGTLVAAPFLLLLLDYWPLGRLRIGAFGAERGGAVPTARLVREKLPLLGLALAVIAVEFAFVSAADNPWLRDPPFLHRAGNALVAYIVCLRRLLWPTGLAVVYPTPEQMGAPFWSASVLGGALLLLVAITALAARASRRHAYLGVGWLWFLGMLFPMVGLIPSGLRVVHDRYLYVPLIGIAIAVAFGASELVARSRLPRAAAAALAIAALAACGSLSWRQIGVWKDSATLFDHALEVTERNAVIHYSKGLALAKRGELERARVEFEAALAIHPEYPDAHNNLGYLLHQQREIDPAIEHLRRALAARPGWPLAMTNLANALAERGEDGAALELLRGAVAAAPASTFPRYWLAVALQRQGRLAEAALEYREVLRIDPGHPWAQRNLASIRRDDRRPD